MIKLNQFLYCESILSIYILIQLFSIENQIYLEIGKFANQSGRTMKYEIYC